MRVAALLVLGACAGESHGGGGPPPQYDDFYSRYPRLYPDMAGPVMLDATTPMVSLHLRSSIAMTTSTIQRSNENVGLTIKAYFTHAKARLSVYPEGGDPAMVPGKTIEIGDVSIPNLSSEYGLFMRTFEDCTTPCVRIEDYRFDFELLEGDSTELTWYADNVVRLSEPYGENVPADDETFALELLTD